MGMKIFLSQQTNKSKNREFYKVEIELICNKKSQIKWNF